MNLFTFSFLLVKVEIGKKYKIKAVLKNITKICETKNRTKFSDKTPTNKNGGRVRHWTSQPMPRACRGLIIF